MSKYCDAAEFKGKTLTKTVINKNNDEIIFSFADGSEYLMFHSQDCCESVSIDSIRGNLTDLIGDVLEESLEDSERGSDDSHESSTLTTYTFATCKTKVIVSWLGISNGYYSESVQIEKIK